MTDLPQWAMEKAADVFSNSDSINLDYRDSNKAIREARLADIDLIARALVEAEARGIERAAKVLEEGYEMDVAIPYYEDGNPSKHDKCSHDKYHWEDCEGCALAAIRKLMEQDNG